MNEVIKGLKEVFSDWRYVVTAIFILLVFYSINVFISSYKTIVSFFREAGFFETAILFFNLGIGFKDTILFSSFVSLVIISLLFGMLVSLIAYKANHFGRVNNKLGVLGAIGVFLGILVPGCAVCGLGLSAVIGLGAGFLSFLPYEGLELSALSIALLGFGVYKVAKDLTMCRLSKNMLKNVKGGRK